MESNQKWENLGLSNDFIFSKVMRENQICKKTLELILGVEIEKIEYVETQREEKEALDSKGIRMDVYVRDGKGTIYNCEMQTINERNLPKRSRYYHSMMTIADMEPGELYSMLHNSFVIFICTFDPFGSGLHKYTFQNRCEENMELVLEDGETTVFLNTEGLAEDIPEELRAFLDYVGGRESEDEFVQELKDRVETLKKSAKEKAEYMTLEMKINEERYKAKQEGFEKGHEEGHQQAVFELVRDNIISPFLGAERLSLSLDEFINKMTEAGYKNPLEVKA